MERNEILKSVGFSDKFIDSLNEFEKSVPTNHLDITFEDFKPQIIIADSSGEILVSKTNDNYSSSLIVKNFSH